MSVITPKDCFHQPQVADLRLIACPGAEELTNLIDKLGALEPRPATRPIALSSRAPAPASRAATPRVWSRSRCAATIFLSLLTPATTA